MKTNIVYIILFILLVSSNIEIKANWENRGEYLELLASDKKIKQILTPIDSNYFLVVDSGNILKKISYNGEIISEKNLKVEDYFFLQVSRDALSSIHLLRETTEIKDSEYGPSYRDSIFIVCISLENDSVTNKFLMYSYYTHWSGKYIKDSYDTYYDFNHKTGNSFLAYKKREENGSEFGYSDRTLSGVAIHHHKNLDFRLRIDVIGGYKYFDVSDDLSKGLILTYYDYHSAHNNKIEENNMIWRFSFFDADNKNVILLQTRLVEIGGLGKVVLGSFPNGFKLANKNNYFVAWYNNSINKYYFYGRDVVATDNFVIKSRPLIAHFSQNDKYLIVSAPEKTIDIYDFNKNELIYSYDLLDDEIATILAVPPHKNGFLAANNAGAVKFFTQDTILSSVAELKDFVGFSINPNPANDYIILELSENFECFEEQNIEIYSTYGDKLMTQKINSAINNNFIKLDVQTLPPGMYIIRIGNKTEKFIKI